MAKLDGNTALIDSDKGITLATAGRYIPHDIVVKPNSSFTLNGSVITGIINNQDITLTNNSGKTITLTNSGIIKTNELTVTGKTVKIGTTTVTNDSGALIESTIGNITGGNLTITTNAENTNCVTAGADISGIAISFNATAARATGGIEIGAGWVSKATTKYLSQTTKDSNTITRYITSVSLLDGKRLDILNKGITNFGATYSEDAEYYITGVSTTGGNSGKVLFGANTGTIFIYNNGLNAADEYSIYTENNTGISIFHSNTGTIANTTNDGTFEVGVNNKTTIVDSNVKELNVTDNSGTIDVTNNSGIIKTSEFTVETMQDEDNTKFLVLSVG